ncbi:MAG: hypothetical protein R2873_07830 [Caldilineaceae bacterium]
MGPSAGKVCLSAAPSAVRKPAIGADFAPEIDGAPLLMDDVKLLPPAIRARSSVWAATMQHTPLNSATKSPKNRPSSSRQEPRSSARVNRSSCPRSASVDHEAELALVIGKRALP